MTCIHGATLGCPICGAKADHDQIMALRAENTRLAAERDATQAELQRIKACQARHLDWCDESSFAYDEMVKGLRTELAEARTDLAFWKECTRREICESAMLTERLALAEGLIAEVDVMMDTAVISGVRSVLAPAYADHWADLHTRLRAALAGSPAKETT